MVKSSATSVKEYLAELPPDRREAIEKVRNIILDNLADGFEEKMNWGMITYEIPLSTYPETYNKQPLMMAALASQKNYMAVYLMTIYGFRDNEDWFKEEYKKTGKKLDMGKSCVRFKTLGDLPLELVARVISDATVPGLIEMYEHYRK